MNRTTARKVLSSYVEEPVAGLFAKLGFSPNGITLLGLIGAGVSAYFISTGTLWLGGVVMLLAGVLDLFDGALARTTGRVSRFGALLDSVVDRVSEAVVLLGLLIFYTIQQPNVAGTILVYVALTGSIMVSYLRARSEGLGIDCKVGVMTRPERVAIIGIGLIISQLLPITMLVVLGLIAALTIFTSIQRLFHTWRSLQEEQ